MPSHWLHQWFSSKQRRNNNNITQTAQENRKKGKKGTHFNWFYKVSKILMPKLLIPKFDKDITRKSNIRPVSLTFKILGTEILATN